MVSGLVLTVWIVAEVAFLRTFHGLDAVYLLLGGGILLIAFVRDVREENVTREDAGLA